MVRIEHLSIRAFLNWSTDLTQADVRLKLAQQDVQNIHENGSTVNCHVSPSAMISMGLELEESKYVPISPQFLFSVRWEFRKGAGYSVKFNL
jgi:hypothetical protein